MDTGIKTEQEKFWEGSFGDEYSKRKKNHEGYLASNIAFFSRALKQTKKINSILELGANVGSNLQAINQLLPQAHIEGVEINKDSAIELDKWLKTINVNSACYHDSIFDFETQKTYDLVLLKTVLIHINPEKLADVYKKIHQLSAKYIIIAEYYNPFPVDVVYRGHKDKLFKRDFCGELLQTFPDLHLVDYGFVYHLDQKFPQDDVNWFLLEKTSDSF